MSHFYADAIHPETGETRRALFMDGYFGGHRYGIKFDGEERIWREEDVKKSERREE